MNLIKTVAKLSDAQRRRRQFQKEFWPKLKTNKKQIIEKKNFGINFFNVEISFRVLSDSRVEFSMEFTRNNFKEF